MSILTVEPACPGAVFITLNRPEKRNAFDWEMLRAFNAALDELEADRAVRVAIVRSAVDRVFVAGGDIAVMRDLTVAEGTRFVYAGHKLMRRIEESPIVFVAAIGGFALGGGTEIALACDCIVASEAATFGLPEVTIGLFPGWGGSQRLPRVVGIQRAKELIYSGRRIPADEALRIGLATQVVPADDLDAAAVRMAESFIANSPTAIERVKHAITQGTRVSLDQGLVIEAEAWLANLASPNRVEGLSAFLEKRKPEFKVD
jgi:enoyl-CoA hydratase/carnithine racemase